jgi:hypothetical protein
VETETLIEQGAETHCVIFGGDRRVPVMNVSTRADAEFVRALEREEPMRYAALLRNMRRSIATTAPARVGRKRRADAKHGTVAAKQAAYRARQAAAA